MMISCPCAHAQGHLLFSAGRKVKTTTMSSNIEAKKQTVSEIVEKLKKAQSMVIVSYKGITVAEVTELRNQFRAAGVEYVVLKNTLVRRALQELNIAGLDEHLEGPSAFAFGMNDPVSPAKIVYNFIAKTKDNRLSVKAGLMGEEVLTDKQVKALSELPSREVLLSRLVGSLQAPVAKLVYFLEALRKQQAGEE